MSDGLGVLIVVLLAAIAFRLGQIRKHAGAIQEQLAEHAGQAADDAEEIKALLRKPK